MPLAFTSRSHGTVAFGFFNIQTDMLLLQRRFFFADQFCGAARALAAGGDGSEAALEGWRIDDPAKVGDLHGAIAGQVLTGFIGATYDRWPFPALPRDFKQDPDGSSTQAETVALIGPYADQEQSSLRWAGQVISVGEFAFDLDSFAQLILYVEQGGYPRWKDERRPLYVTRMMRALRGAGAPF